MKSKSCRVKISTDLLFDCSSGLFIDSPGSSSTADCHFTKARPLPLFKAVIPAALVICG